MWRLPLPLTVAAVFVSGRCAAFSGAQAPRGKAFARLSSETRTGRGRAMFPLGLVPPAVESANLLTDGVNGVAASGTALIAKATIEEWKDLAKSAVIVALFGGGLIPATISANKAMMGTLMGKRKEPETIENKATYLDPTLGAASYVEDSGATGPMLPYSGLLFAPEDIPLADVVAVVGRINDVDSLADWRNLPSAKLPGAVDPENPPMWLPRATFKANIRKAPFLGWPTDAKGEPIGGEELKLAEGSRIAKKGATIGDAALDAVFDTWAWGASVATPDKVASQLGDWRADPSTLKLGDFTGAAIRGRAATGIAALTFIAIQVIAYGALFVGPLLRTFFDIDIGFGQVGQCDPETCVRLFG